MDKLLSFCKRRGFFLRLPRECRQQKGVCVYGPLGVELRRNIINEWWHTMVISTNNIYGISSGILTHQESNLQGQECKVTDKLVKEHIDDQVKISQEEDVNPFLHLLEVAKTLKLEPSFGVAEISKTFNRDTESSAPFESLDSERMGVNLVCPVAEERQLFSQWQKNRLRWWRRLSRNPERFSLGEGAEEGGSRQQCSIQYEFPWGSCDVESIRNRGDQDLKQWAEADTSVFKTNGSNDAFSLISMEAGVDRAALTYLSDAYNEISRSGAASPEVLMKFHISLAPYKVAVIPSKETNTKLCMYCKLLSEELKHAGIPTVYCESGPVEDRLRLQNVVGTPYRVIADEGTLETGIVSLQDRDTTGQEDMNGRDVLPSIQRMLIGARIN